ncbi:MAG: chemotaxis protein CheA [Gemmatimonadaceae bacterium]|nr:chemotaxis protein CheA [Gemmatimonadaceae bacterium]
MDTSGYAKLFLTESREHLVEINNALLALERDANSDAVDELFRAVHSIKGMSGAMGYKSVTELSHELENLLDKLRNGKILVTTQVMDTLFTSSDALETAISLATSDKPRDLIVNTLVDQLRELAQEPEEPQTFTAEFQVLAETKGAAQAKAEHAPRHVRIDARRLDNLMNAVGELVIVRDRLTLISAQIDDPSLSEATLKASQLIGNLQNEIMTIRMLPVWQVFDRFPRVVRDTAHLLGKRVEFIIEGKEIELDRSMLEEMGEPVLHLLRNALDHGIELPEERVAKDKPAVARLTLTAERDRSTVLIRVSDDGRGIDPDLVLPRAIELGLIEEGTTTLSDEDLIRVISRPGFSTAKKITDISGRGVGFDIVATRVRALGGSLEVRSVPGRGTTVTLRLPLTLAISRALLARVEEEVYAIPLTHIVETFSLAPGMLQHVKGREVLVIRDEPVPAIRLRDRVGLQKGNGQSSQVVLMELADRRAGLVVDEFLGQQEIVMKQFDAVGEDSSLFSGATILGDGAPALIIDPTTLV